MRLGSANDTKECNIAKITERPDITPYLVHFTKGETLVEAFAIFKKIVSEGRLIGGTGFIKGRYQCVCFSEAPLTYLADVFRRERAAGIKYQPFGVLAAKTWLFQLGARPVLYQPDDEYEALPEAIRYRHVRYEPSAARAVDFTWEREWRLLTGELKLNHRTCTLVLPSQEYVSELKRQYEQDQYAEWTQIFDDISAWQMAEAFRWRVIILDDLSPGDVPTGAA